MKLFENNTEMCFEVMFWRHESFVDFPFCELENQDILFGG